MAKYGMVGTMSDFEGRYFPNYAALTEHLGHYRALQPEGKVGFVSGVWDLPHLGHLTYIEKAHEGVDLLVVGVDTDEITRARKKKGELDRPIVLFEERARNLSFLRAVDIITVVGEDFIEVLSAVRPDRIVFSKTTREMTEEHRSEYQKYVGEIVLLDAQAPPETVSTTARIRLMRIGAFQEAERRLEESLVETVRSTFEQLREGS